MPSAATSRKETSLGPPPGTPLRHQHPITGLRYNSLQWRLVGPAGCPSSHCCAVRLRPPARSICCRCARLARAAALPCDRRPPHPAARTRCTDLGQPARGPAARPRSNPPGVIALTALTGSDRCPASTGSHEPSPTPTAAARSPPLAVRHSAVGVLAALQGAAAQGWVATRAPPLRHTVAGTVPRTRRPPLPPPPPLLARRLAASRRSRTA